MNPRCVPPTTEVTNALLKVPTLDRLGLSGHCWPRGQVANGPKVLLINLFSVQTQMQAPWAGARPKTWVSEKGENAI
jgi:hypothetical protein